jgi:VCBS repeat-containing protein
MATDNWIGNSGDWAIAGGWSTGAVPAVEDDVVIDSLLTQGAQVQLATDATAGTLALLDGASLTIATGGNLTLTGGVLYVDGSSTLTVDGGKLSVAGTYVYSEIDGTLIADHGASVDFESYLYFSTLTIAHGSTLTLSSAASTMTVNFGATINNDPNVLVLGDPAQFIGTINGFGPNDAVDLPGVNGAYLSQEGGLVLVWEGSTVVATLSFTGSFYENDFQLTDDGHGGETVSLAYFLNHAPALTLTQPTITLVESGLSGAGVVQATASASASDTDNGDSVTFITTGFSPVSGTLWSETGTYGTLTLDTSDGAMTYTLDNASANTQALGNGDTATDSFTISVTDNYGATTSKTVTFSIHGSNDAPIITAPDHIDIGTLAPVFIAMSFTDAESASQTYTATLSDSVNTIGVASDPANGAQITGSGNHLTITGTYAQVEQALYDTYVYAASGNSDTLTLTITDSQGASTSSSIAVTAAPPAPTISAAAPSNALVEAVGSDPGTDTATLLLTFSSDLSNSNGGHPPAGYPVLPNNYGSPYGSIHIDTDPDTGTALVTYTLDDNSFDVQELGNGDSVTDSFTFTVYDSAGDTASTTVNFVIEGVNDAPTLTLPGAALTTTAGTPLALSGLSFFDPEFASQIYTVTLSDVAGLLSTTAADGSTVTGNGTNSLSITGTFDSILSDLAAVTFTGSTSDTITFEVTDSQGGDSTQHFAVTVTPATTQWSAPVLSYTAPTTTLVVPGAGATGVTSAAATLTIAPATSNDTVSYALTGFTHVSGTLYQELGTYGTLTLDTSDGALTYTLDVSLPATHALAASAVVTDSFTLTANDAHGLSASQTVSFTIDGSLDAPIVHNLHLYTTSGSSFSLTSSDLLEGNSDPLGYSLSITAVDGARHGTVTLDDHGDVVYSAYQAYLGSDSFQVTVSNGHGGTTLETVSVTMTNQQGIESSTPAYVYGGNDATGQIFDVSGDDIGHQLYGSSGNDTIYGGNNNDALNGGAGNDTIYGGGGNDTITGGPGADMVWGGAGANSFVFRVGDIANPASSGGYDQIMDFTGAGDGYHAGGDIIQFFGFSSAAKLTFDAAATAAAASADPTAHYYTLSDGSYQGEIVVHYAGNAVLTTGDYGFYP